MTPTQRLFIGFIVLVTMAGGFAAGRAIFRPGAHVDQPVAFSHSIHVQDLELECATCHEFWRTGAHAGLPPIETCLGCHDDPAAEKAEIRRIRELAEAGNVDPFRKLFRIADHTYYSHRRHAAIAEIACETCHGAIAGTSAPPGRPLVRITMDFCLDCHRTRGVPSDCTRCHR